MVDLPTEQGLGCTHQPLAAGDSAERVVTGCVPQGDLRRAAVAVIDSICAVADGLVDIERVEQSCHLLGGEVAPLDDETVLSEAKFVLVGDVAHGRNDIPVLLTASILRVNSS